MWEVISESSTAWLVVCMLLGGTLTAYCLAFIFHSHLPVCTSNARLDGRTALITGGTSGIGLSTAVELAQRGARVVVASRRSYLGHTSVVEIKEKSGSNKVSYEILDLGNLSSLHTFAHNFKQKYKVLHILINNAGIAYSEDEKTVEGYCMLYTTNYLAHFLLTNLLLDVLIGSAPSRIVNVSSIAHGFVDSPLNFTAVDNNKHRGRMFPYLRGYDISKLALVLHAKEMAKQLSGTEVTINSVHPGFAITDLWKSYLYLYGKTIYYLIMAAGWPLFRSCERACQSVVYCAVSQEVNDITGKYFKNCAISREGALCHDSQLAKELWDVSSFMTKFIDQRSLQNSSAQRHEEVNGNPSMAISEPNNQHEISRA